MSQEPKNSPSVKGEYAEGGRGLVPKLRFPEFRDAGEWEGKPLGIIAENLDNRRIPITESDRAKGEIPYYGASGIVDYINDFIFDENLLCISEDGANLVARTSPIAFSISGKSWVNNHAHVLRFENRSTQKIIENYLNSIKLDDFLTGMAQPKLNRAMLDSIPIPLPSFNEQQKIADCLSSLDELITAEAQTLDTLKAHKKGLMQQLFPAEGETLPKLRFPEFRDAGEWEEKKFSSMVQLISGLHLSPDQYGNEGTVPYFTGPSDFTDRIQKISKWTRESTSIAKENDTLITVKGSGVGEIWYLTLPRVAMGRQLMAVCSTNNSSRFIYQFLLTKRTRFEDLASGNLIPGLSRGDILDLEARFPSLPEQQKIADCLSSLDEQIAAQSQKLDALKAHKKGLMQQLFPALDEVQG